MRKNLLTKIKRYIPYVFIFIMLFVYKCPIKAIFGVSCAGCGLTRAMVCAIKLDFVNAFNYHPLFGLVAVNLMYLIVKPYIKKHIKIRLSFEIAILIITVLSLIIVYLIRMKYDILPD